MIDLRADVHYNMTKLLFFMLLVVFYINVVDSLISEDLCPNIKTDVISRRRRALSFPDGSNFIATIALVKALLVGLPLGWNIALEVDVIYPTPGVFELLKYKYPRLGLHHKQRRDLWDRFETVLNTYNMNGEDCILRTICESQNYLAPKDSLFVHDIFRTLFTLPDIPGPDDKYSKASKMRDCSIYFGEDRCPFSLIQLLLSYKTY